MGLRAALGAVRLRGRDAVHFPRRYVRLCEVVDHVFPLLKRSHSSDFPCSDTFSNFTFWREPPPPFENQDIHSASA